jgi:hypothetical protein
VGASSSAWCVAFVKKVGIVMMSGDCVRYVLGATRPDGRGGERNLSDEGARDDKRETGEMSATGSGSVVGARVSPQASPRRRWKPGG